MLEDGVTLQLPDLGAGRRLLLRRAARKGFQALGHRVGEGCPTGQHPPLDDLHGERHQLGVVGLPGGGGGLGTVGRNLHEDSLFRVGKS